MAILGTNDLGNGAQVFIIDHDPKTVATSAQRGSLAIRQDSGNEGRTYKKKDDGSTTNWEELHGLVTGQNQIVNTINAIPQPGSSGTPSNASTSSSTYVARARLLIDFSDFNLSATTTKGKLHARCMVSGGPSPSGDIRLFNVTDGVEMAKLSFTETIFTTKSTTLSSIPSSGIKVLEVQMRQTAPAASITCEVATIDLTMEA